MELEPVISKFLGDIIRPIVTTAVEDVIKRTPVSPPDEMITVKEACQILRCSEPTFYSHVNNGNIKLVKNGRSSLVHKGKLLDDLSAGRLRLRKDKHRK